MSVQERFSERLEGPLQRNSLCNLLVFHYNVSGDNGSFLFSAKLLYSDLCCSLPTEAIVSCTRKWAVQGSGAALKWLGVPPSSVWGTKRSKFSFFCTRKELAVHLQHQEFLSVIREMVNEGYVDAEACCWDVSSCSAGL